MGKRESKTPVKIYSYGCRVDSESELVIDDEIRKGVRYYNNLLRVEIDAVESYRKMRKGFSDGLAELECELDAINEEISELWSSTKAWRIENGKRGLPEELQEDNERLSEERTLVASKISKMHAEFKARILPTEKEFKAEKKSAQDAAGVTTASQSVGPNAEVLARYLANDTVDEAWKAAATLDAKKVTLKKLARSKRECSSMVGTLVEEEVDQARKMSGGRPMRFKSSRFAEGRFGGQVRVSLADVMAGKGQLALTPNSKPGSKKAHQFWRGTLRLRGDTKANFEVRMHRELPNDAFIKRAWILRRKRGRGWVYNLQLSVESNQFPTKKTSRPGRDVAITFGKWRTNTGAEVCYWRSACGSESGTIEIPLSGPSKHQPNAKRSPLEKIAFARSIKAFQDQAYGAWRKPTEDAVFKQPVTHVLGEWLRRMGHAPAGGRMRRSDVEWMADAVSIQLLGEERGKLWKLWVTERKEHGHDLFCSYNVARKWAAEQGLDQEQEQLAWWLYVWLRKDSHLEELRIAMDGRGRRGLKQVYRNVANDLAKRFDRCIISKASLVWSEFEHKGANKEVAKHQLAPGECREIVVDAFGERAVSLKAEESSRCRKHCSKCGAKVSAVNGVVDCCGKRLTRENECANLIRVANGEWFEKSTPKPK